MSTRAEDRPGRSHVPPTPPAKLAPADDPAWAHTLTLAALAREARPTTTNEETTMADTPAKGLEWIADRLVGIAVDVLTVADELRHQSIEGVPLVLADEAPCDLCGAVVTDEEYEQGHAYEHPEPIPAPPLTFPTDGSMETAP